MTLIVWTFPGALMNESDWLTFPGSTIKESDW
jgi:hypothetical protein